ncbi:hypothetical protein GUJ93_ZPchr0008g12970 [Zizania palustris]|uniref:Uncharacterized protein n=1 Tax=Zizania palustris TaxID=103762 RepID=A0A8J5V3X8_ZIZPA|nr:hypothetical protein GUJ93_ZPchr0008g12970 [Zizania palustris]
MRAASRSRGTAGRGQGTPARGGGGGSSSGGAVERRRSRSEAHPAMAAPTAVQRLFEACREVFSGPEASAGAVPPPAGVERIKSVLGNPRR